MKPSFHRSCAGALSLTANPASAADKLTPVLDWFVNRDHTSDLRSMHVGVAE